MWTCKFCNEEFDFKTLSEKGNHSRWCDKNPKRNSSNENLRKASIQYYKTKYGEDKEFTVVCNNCKRDFIVIEKEYKFPIKDRYYCCDFCARSYSAKINAEKNGITHYRAICKKYNAQICIIPECGFHKIVDVHHVDENSKNNSKENLVYLCPNHHRMFHSSYRNEISPHIEKYIKDKWGE